MDRDPFTGRRVEPDWWERFGIWVESLPGPLPGIVSIVVLLGVGFVVTSAIGIVLYGLDDISLY